MRVSGPSSPKPASPAKRGGKAGAAGFSNLLDTSKGAVKETIAPTSGVAGVGAVDAVLALQATDNPGERRERALRQGRRMVDALDRLRLSMLETGPTPAHLGLLRRASEETRTETGDAGLDEALAQIEQRTAVEIAKLEKRQD
ncbi:MAG: flagellar assembly protein FliX [Pseudomonadota bacterium]